MIKVQVYIFHIPRLNAPVCSDNAQAGALFYKSRRGIKKAETLLRVSARVANPGIEPGSPP